MQKQNRIFHKNGFTLIELLIVVLIIGILSALAMPQYMRAVERSRMTEAVTLLDAVSKAQQRNWMGVNKFSTNFATLDVAPQGATGATYYTQGDPVTGVNSNGFAITLYDGEYDEGYAEAVRFNYNKEMTYNYTLVRFYLSEYVTCESSEPNGQSLCADFCGIEDPVSACCSDGTDSACYEDGTES